MRKRKDDKRYSEENQQQSFSYIDKTVEQQKKKKRSIVQNDIKTLSQAYKVIPKPKIRQKKQKTETSAENQRASYLMKILDTHTTKENTTQLYNKVDSSPLQFIQLKDKKEQIKKQQKQLLPKLKNELLKKKLHNKIFGNLQQNEIIDEERQQELKVVKQILTGRVSIIWIFVIRDQIDLDLENRIKYMYNGISTDEDENVNIVPRCHWNWQTKTFLELPNCFFKIVTDIPNANDSIKNHRANKRVVEIYIFNNLKEVGIIRALSFKSQERKVKGIYTDLSKIINRAQQEIQNQVQLYRIKTGISQRKGNRKFPSFLKLSGEQKTAATLYRSNLYGALKISVEEKKVYYKQFMDLVKERYDPNGPEKDNILIYQKMKHFTNEHTIQKAAEVLRFYVKQSFYYFMLNSMLRTMKTTYEFKPCVLAFNQTYHAIKTFYQLHLASQNRVLKPMTLYRGTKLRLRDFKSLKPGSFIQMFGFMSTSQSLEVAQNFTDHCGYIFVIHVPEMKITQNLDKYDHGFVDINRHKLAENQFSDERQILFNALNIYKVRQIKSQWTQRGQFQMIHLEYGVIFELLQKKQLNSVEKDVLLNYRYCINMLNDIQDQGDVYLIANQYQQSKKYYANKIKQNKQDMTAYFKLANVQQQCGELDQANKNAKKSLQLAEKKIDLNDKQTCMKVFSVHAKNAQISLEQQDYLTADEGLQNALKFLGNQDPFEKAKKIRQLGQVKFKKGQIKQAYKQLHKSQQLFQHLNEQLQYKKNKAKHNYFWKFLGLICSPMTKEQLDQGHQKQIQQIEKTHKKILNCKEQIQSELITLNKSLTDVSEYAQDKQQYQRCVQKARGYLFKMKASETNDPLMKAKLKVAQATVQKYLNLVQSQKLLNEAIRLVQSSDPYDMKVSDYSQILGRLQKQQLQKYINPKLNFQLKSGQKIKYDSQQQQRLFESCKSNYQKAINVLIYNNKAPNCPEILTIKNQLTQLEMNQSNFDNCEEIISQIKKQNATNYHSEIAKATLLLAKIAFSKGQIKGSFQSINESETILHKALVKKQQPKYILMFESSDIYLQILLYRSKIFSKQLSHDMALKQLDKLSGIFTNKFNDAESHSLYATLQQQYGMVAFNRGEYDEFDEYFQKAISIRKSQMGDINVPNAVSHCNLAKYLILSNDIQMAQTQLQKATQVFSRFDNDHPITWMIHFSNGYYHQAIQKNQEATQLYKSSLKLAEFKFDKSHITISKIKLQYGKTLMTSKRLDESMVVFNQLQNSLGQQLGTSSSKYLYDSFLDDQKLNLQGSLYSFMKQNYEEATESVIISNIRNTQQGVKNYRNKLDLLKKTYKNASQNADKDKSQY